MAQVYTIPEKELLQQIANGDERALKELFDTYRDQLFVFVNKIIHSDEVTRELVMDVYLKIWLGRELLPQVQNIRAFLYSIARNKAIDYFRSASNNPELDRHISGHLELAGKETADSALMIKEYEALLREAISLLSPQRKQAWQLAKDENLTYREIAVKMNITKATVNSHITEAQRFIRQHLARNLDVALVLVLFKSHSG